MSDVIWGNGSSILSRNSFIINVTHRKDGNQLDYSDIEKIIMLSAELPGFPQNEAEWNEDNLKQSVVDAFLKCEIESRNEEGMLVARISHSGVGGW